SGAIDCSNSIIEHVSETQRSALQEKLSVLNPRTTELIMKITAVSAPRFEWVVSKTRPSDFVTLMKPRVMLLAVFTAFVGMVIAPGHLDPLLASLAILAIAIGAGAAGVLNMWYDAD